MVTEQATPKEQDSSTAQKVSKDTAQQVAAKEEKSSSSVK
jgi:hypothetical protein